MRRHVLATGLTLVVLLGVVPQPVVAPVMGVNNQQIKSVSAEDPGQGLSAATQINQFQQQQVMQQRSFEEELERSENDRAVVKARMEALAQQSPAGDGAQAETDAERLVSNARTRSMNGAFEETVSEAVAETDPETVDAAAEGTGMGDRLATMDSADGSTASGGGKWLAFSNGAHSLPPPKSEGFSNGNHELKSVDGDGATDIVLRSVAPIEAIETTADGKLVVAATAPEGQEGTSPADWSGGDLEGGGSGFVDWSGDDIDGGGSGFVDWSGDDLEGGGSGYVATVDPATGAVEAGTTVQGEPGSGDALSLHKSDGQIFVVTSGDDGTQQLHASIDAAEGAISDLDPSELEGDDVEELEDEARERLDDDDDEDDGGSDRDGDGGGPHDDDDEDDGGYDRDGDGGGPGDDD